jgi:E3 ubiquitin-protein ligase UBR4
VLKLLLYCCKIRDHRQALLCLSALALLLETARRAFSVDVVELAKGILLIVESLVMEANESDIGITDSALTISNDLVMLPVRKLQK